MRRDIRELRCLDEADEVLVRWDGRRASGEAEHKGLLGGGFEGEDPIGDA